MSEFSSLLLKIKSLKDQYDSVNVSGVDAEQWHFIFTKFIGYQLSPKYNIFVCPNDDEAEKLCDLFKESQLSFLYYPGLTTSPFSSVIQSEAYLNIRHNTLRKLNSKPDSYNLVLTYQSLFLLTPKPDYFNRDTFTLKVSDILAPDELSQKLIGLGFNPTPTIEEPGTFTKKGEIFDIYPLNHNPIRIHYFDEMIEEIFKVEPDTLKTIKEKPISEILIATLPQGVLNDEQVLNFKSNLRRPSITHKAQNVFRTEIFKKLSEGNLFENYPLYYSLFFKESSTIIDYINPNSQLHFFNFSSSLTDYKFTIEEMKAVYNENIINIEDDYILPEVEQVYTPSINIENFEKFYINYVDIEQSLEQELENKVPLLLDSTNVFYKKRSSEVKVDKYEFIKDLFSIIKKLLLSNGKLVVLYRSDNTRDEIKFLLESNALWPSFKEKISLVKHHLSSGFFYQTENTLFLSESDLFAERIKKTKRRKKQSSDLFADQISTLKEGDFVIHKQFGVGKYLGIDNLNHGSNSDDFLIIEYLDGDKVYVPVYKLNLIQKHAENKHHIKVDNLKTQKFSALKSKAKNSVKKLAFDLLELQAKRKMKKGFSFSPPDHDFKDFELSFSFEETPDQLNAIDDVLEDMQKETPMDRLVCGDVGFGKTEVAMRAAFKAVLDKKQVAILVPTTVLAFQHYNTFVKRFQQFPVNIDFISRFKTTKQVNEILNKLEEGKVDIVIGTHKLLSDKVKFKDLGLLVIDEEQRFGVGHKEKLKLLKENVDCLVLTATPIPRTLQMSFLGIKELSLIQTAPPKRQSIKTYIIKEDDYTLKTAISKELSRGGQVFVVHNRVHDIKEYAAKIKKLVPTAKVVEAHGQMSERELEKRIKEFYEHKYDILVSTTIIESGIDIPSANTMIIDRADTYGLSQLHQLRGRIGRSDKKAYAYFIIPSTKNLSEIANKRLKALQIYADMGSGFSLATSDLEIRGSGDILGAEQSGHIANIGLELYMELLQDAVHELQGKEQHLNRDIEIQTPFSTSIPKKFISDHGLRLKYYKRLANCYDFNQLDEIIDEITDQYGLPPEPVRNLQVILKSRIYFSNLGLLSVKAQSKTITLNFDKSELEKNENLRNKIINFFMQRPKVYKIKPNYSIISSFKENISPKTLLDFAKYIAEHIDPC